MTLIVVFRLNDELLAFADTRVSDREGVSISDFSPKLFVLPVKATAGSPERGKASEWDCALAFSGHALVANFVYASTVAACRNLFGDPGANPISLEQVADLIKKIFEKIVFDAAFRQVNEVRDLIINSAIAVFGYCPVSKELQCFLVRSAYVAGHPIVARTQHEADPIAVVLGSGKSTFDESIQRQAEAKNGAIDIKEAFLAAFNNPNVKSVGGDVQVIRAGKSGVQLPPVLNPTLDPDSPDLKLFGLELTEIGGAGDFKIGYVAPGSVYFGFNLEGAINRTMLRRLGFDPDAVGINQRLRNNAAIFGAAASAVSSDSKVVFDAPVYSVATLRALVGNPYFGFLCPYCQSFDAIIPNSERKDISGVWQGNGLFNVLCARCGGNYFVPPVFLLSKVYRREKTIRGFLTSTTLLCLGRV